MFCFRPRLSGNTIHILFFRTYTSNCSTAGKGSCGRGSRLVDDRNVFHGKDKSVFHVAQRSDMKRDREQERASFSPTRLQWDSVTLCGHYDLIRDRPCFCVP